MRTEPTWRIPFGMLMLLVGLAVYAIVIARYVPGIVGGWHPAFQTIVYIALGLAWLLPLGRFLQWMETGSTRPPEDSDTDT